MESIEFYYISEAQALQCGLQKEKKFRLFLFLFNDN